MANDLDLDKVYTQAAYRSTTVTFNTIRLDKAYTLALYAAPRNRFKIWSGGAWGLKPAKAWTGSAWATKPVKTWTGSAWV